MDKNNFIQIHFSTADDDIKGLLIALMVEAGYTGFEEENDDLNAFISEKSFNQHELDEISKLAKIDYTRSIVKTENWNAQWESSFEPIIVNDLVAIRAAFHQPLQNVKHEIIITPKMSFGTGHHATTYMMIEQMEGMNFINKAVVDFGTGTAVLAILAEKMGAAKIDAIDHDEWSIENAVENAAANNCSKINLIKAETIAGNQVYDIILANINLNVILENLAAIKAVSKKGTVILLSGFIKADEMTMIHALAENEILPLKIIQKGEWICMLAHMK